MPAPQQYPSARRVGARAAQRQLDGVPHDIVGLSALFSVGAEWSPQIDAAWQQLLADLQDVVAQGCA